MFLIHLVSVGFFSNASPEAIITESGVLSSCEASAIKSFCFSKATSAGFTIQLVRVLTIKKNITANIKNTIIEDLRLFAYPCSTKSMKRGSTKAEFIFLTIKSSMFM